jgi:arylsulfatase A-like enzyme
VGLVSLGSGGAIVPAARASSKPNLIFILTDDQRIGTMSVVPSAKEQFPISLDGFVTTPLCCPSRSSYLTGRYAHNTHVETNHGYPAFHAREASSIGPWLQAQDYYTGFLGKYFNHYFTRYPTPPGWNEFRAEVWPRPTIAGTRWRMREHFFDGTTTHDRIVAYPNARFPNAHFTRVIATYAASFIQHAASPTYNPAGKPWALFVWTVAPNGQNPEPRYANAPLPQWHKPPSFMEPDMSDKPLEVRLRRAWATPAKMARLRRAQLRELMSVNDLVRRVFNTVDRMGFSSNTDGVYASDNGRFWGEHHLKGKLRGYEEAVRVPMRVHLPGASHEHIDGLAANIDVATTLLDWAGDPRTHNANGTSLLSLINAGTSAWRRSLLLENFAHYQWIGLRTGRYKYIRWIVTGHQELYDLLRDPYELTNIAREHPTLDARFRAEAEALQAS